MHLIWLFFKEEVNAKYFFDILRFLRSNSILNLCFLCAYRGSFLLVCYHCLPSCTFSVILVYVFLFFGFLVHHLLEVYDEAFIQVFTG